MKIKSICVFCGSSFGNSDLYRIKTEELGRYIAEQNIRLVYGGGGVGLMGVLAETVMNNGGKVTGVIPELIHGKVKELELTETIITEDMHERKKIMYSLADAFIALPGGIGTLEEIAEIYTWQQLGYHTKAVSLFNVNGYFDFLYRYLQQGCSEGFIKDVHLNRLIIEDDTAKLLNAIDRYDEQTIDKWS